MKKGTSLILRMAAVSLLFMGGKISAQFTAGNLVVYQASDGAVALANTGNPIVLKEYTPLGGAGITVTIPSTGTNALIVSGSATSEGMLTLSQNGRYLVFGAYAQTLPNATALAGSASSVISRGVGIVDAAGGYTRAAASNTFHSTNNIRGAASDGFNNYWSSGANDGTDYFGTANPTVNVQNANTNTRMINVFNGNLYFSTGSGTTGVYQVGSGLPVVGAQTNTPIIVGTGIGVGTPSPYSFFFNAAGTICYIADDRSFANGGGIQKWIYSGSWTYTYTLPTGATVGARGVVADFSGPTPKVYATTAEASSNRLIAISDVGPSSTATTIATSPASNAIFRGLAFAPYCTAPSISNVTSNAPVCSNQTLALGVTAAGTSPFTYSWTGSGSFNTPTAQTTSVTGASTGNYSITVSNSCGSAVSGISVNINPVPSVTVNSALLCAGASATLTASGATTYSWDFGPTSASVAVSPTATTVYTVSGTSAGCTDMQTATVTVNSNPAVSVNSASVCSGSSVTLNASGANTYTWDFGPTNASVAVSPTVNTSYTVTGTSSVGCTGSAISMVTVVGLPSLSVNSATICAGASTTLTATGANTYTWDFGPNTASVSVSPSVSTVYTVSGSSLGCSSSNTAAITVNPLPTVTANSATVCNGGFAILTATGANTYSWSNGSNNFSISVSPSVTTNYTVSGTSLAGCTNSFVTSVSITASPSVSVNSSTICAGLPAVITASGAVTYTWSNGSNNASISITPSVTTSYTVMGTVPGCGVTPSNVAVVNVNPLPSLTVTGNNTVCAGSSLTQTVSGAQTYSWSTGALTSTVSVTPSITISYSVSGTNTNNCTASIVKTITVVALPTISVASTASVLCTGDQATLTASGASAYTWATGAGATSVVSPTATTVYSVVGTNTAGCSSTMNFTQTVSACTGIASNIPYRNNDVSIYPNPFMGIVNLDFADVSVSYIVSVYNMTGQIILRESIKGNGMINLEKLSKGIYLLKIESGEGRASVKRIVKE